MIFMMWKRLICALIALSFMLAGSPVLAAKGIPCPMTKSEQARNMLQGEMSMENCQDCPEMAKAQEEKSDNQNGCCDDAACNTKCTATGSSASLFPSGTVQWSVQVASKKLETLPYLLPPSQLGKTPERPPKNIS